MLAQPVELGLPARQQRARVELRRHLGRFRGRHGKSRVLREDRVLQLPEPLSGLDSQPFEQAPPGVVVRLQRVRLPVAAVEGEHQL
jgi:hypothetical protein